MEWLIGITIVIIVAYVVVSRIKRTDTATNRIVKINEEYFGTDRSKNYLKDDFTRVLKGTVVRSILVELFVELSKERRNTRDLPNGGIAYGDFDPDNAGFFANIFGSYQKGWMIDVRMLLGGRKNKNRGGREAGTGGRFIDELVGLSADDFMEYYIKPDSVTIPRCLLGKLFSEKPDDTVTFLKSNKDIIENVVADLIGKAKKFQSKGYHNKIIKDYEALELHKDNRPEKYDLRAEPTDFPFSNGTMMVRSPKATVAIREIAQCLNDFAEVIGTYQLLVGKNTDFFGSNWPLDVFISRTLDLFAKDLPENTVEKIGKDVVKYLHPSVHIAGWDHEKFSNPKMESR